MFFARLRSRRELEVGDVLRRVDTAEAPPARFPTTRESGADRDRDVIEARRSGERQRSPARRFPGIFLARPRARPSPASVLADDEVDRVGLRAPPGTGGSVCRMPFAGRSVERRERPPVPGHVDRVPVRLSAVDQGPACRSGSRRCARRASRGRRRSSPRLRRLSCAGGSIDATGVLAADEDVASDRSNRRTRRAR